MDEDSYRFLIMVRPDGIGPPPGWPHTWVSYLHGTVTVQLDETLAAVAASRAAVSFADWHWCAIKPEGGWTSVASASEVIEGSAIEEAIDRWWHEHDEDPWQWQFRLVRINKEI